MMINNDFIKWAQSFSGCDGGNINGKIWLCGIEWGGGDYSIELDFQKETLLMNSSIPHRTPEDRNKILRNENRRSTYDINAYKLLSVIHEEKSLKMIDYRAWVNRVKPFEENSDYFKLNLYPISFKTTNDALWNENWKQKTGIENKYLYRLSCWKYRFPIFKELVNTYNPQLILCVGKSYTTDYLLAFEGLEKINFSGNIKTESIENDELLWLNINNNQTILCITPFLTNAGNLVGNDKISKFGIKISEILKQKKEESK